jgi:DUF2939 family protein
MKRLVLALAAVLALSGCATVQTYDAARDVHAFLVAVRDGDKATFDAHVDRRALKAQLKSRLIAEVGTSRGADSPEAFGAVLLGPLVDAGLDILIQPQVFRAAASMAGYGAQTRIPNAALISRQMQALPDGRACVIVDRRCTFMFKEEGGVWRLIAFEGDLAALRDRLKPRR